MELNEILILLIILFLAIPFGYFLHKALHNIALKNMLEQLDNMKLINSQSQQLIDQLKADNTFKTEQLERLQKDYFQLTLATQDLQKRESNLHRQLLEKQYDVPPDYDHLKESNALLQREIQRNRAKLKKWKSKDYIQANKKLYKKLKKLKKRVHNLQEENEKYSKSHEILSQVREITAVQLAPVKKEKKQPRSKEVLPKFKEENPFTHQPEFKKKQIFKEIFSTSPTENPPVVIDLESQEKTLIDLVGMDEHSLGILKSKGIHSFDDLVQMKIQELREIFQEEPKEYPFETWPIQSRLALRGEWDLIDEYKEED